MLYLDAEKEPVCAGDTVTLTLSFSGNNRFAIMAQLQYDQNLFSLEACRSVAASEWAAESRNGRILCYDTNLTHPITEKTALCELTFLISEEAEGKDFTVSLIQATAADLEQQTTLEDIVFTTTVHPSRSADASLSFLHVKGYTLSPEFSPSVRSYTITENIIYPSRDIHIDAIPNNPNAAVTVTGTPLKPGQNNVRILVTAENGSQRVYTISVYLEAGTYPESRECRLSALQPSSGILSPAFEQNTFRYVLYLPYEITSVTLTGTPVDKYAQTEPVTVNLKGPGVTAATVVCRAENGDISRYQVEIVVLPQYFGVLPTIILPNTDQTNTMPPETSAETAPETKPAVSEQSTHESETTASETVTGTESETESAPVAVETNLYPPLALWIAALLLTAGAGGAMGYGLCFAQTDKKKNKKNL